MPNSNIDPAIRLPKEIKYILVDIHGVLTDGQERKRFLDWMSAKYNMDSDLHNSLWANHISALDINQETATQYIQIINEAFNTQFSADEYYQVMAKQIQSNQPLLELLKNLSTHHQVCIVSDNLSELSNCLKPIFGSQFEQYQQFYSFEFGKIKAEGLFEIVLEQLKAAPSECLFIDDNIQNVKVAKALGIKSLQFTTNQQLFHDLTMDFNQDN